ncbi:MAG: clan AA aspartic protease [Steroidobacteraceae bacterium]|jgi:clan AA aspartic protease|nr:clan AA aspartic protease [Steroidobacteraceae bacterium]
MGLITAPFELSNPRDAKIPPIRVDALVDTGAMTLCLPAPVAEALALEELERREVTLADGGRHLVPYVGPVKVGFGKRGCFTGAFVLGQRVLVGAIPLEDMDLVINPATRQVTVNPASPDIPSAIVMRASAFFSPAISTDPPLR